MRVEITTIPHAKQRYDTVGDWQFNRDKTALFIRVSKTGNWREEMSIAFHELFEALACLHGNVSEKDVDRFDISFKGEGEPGDDKDCPYYEQHQFATVAERLLVMQLGLNWEEYDAKISNL